MVAKELIMAERAMALNEPKEGLLSIATKLEAAFCGSSIEGLQQSIDKGRASSKLLLLIEPPDLNLYSAGDPVSLVCFAENTALTFWSFTAEVNHDENLAAQARQWSQYQAAEFDHYQFSRLHSGTTITLSFCLRHARLDLNNLTGSILPLPTNSAVHARHISRYQTVREALDAHDLLRSRGGNVYQVYQDTVSWAKSAQLMTAPRSAITRKGILWMLLALQAADELSISDFVSRYSDIEEIRSVKTSLNRSADHSAIKHLDLISMEIQKLKTTPAAWKYTPLQHFARFLQNYAFYILVDGECHDGRARSAYDAAMAETLDSIDKALTRDMKQGQRIWPESCQSSAVDARELFLIGAAPQGTVSKSLRTRIIRALITQEGCAYAEYMIRIRAEPLTSNEMLELDLMPCPASGNHRTWPAQEMSHPTSKDSAAPRPSPRFRSARQVLARLQHDPEHRLISYEVGYMDRFDGLKWKPAEDFAKPTEDEEFIPEHRVRQVRCADNHKIIWDRASKTDESQANLPEGHQSLV